jgi:hypothetical protein
MSTTPTAHSRRPAPPRLRHAIRRAVPAARADAAGQQLPRTPAELAAQATYPLDVCVCRTCSLVQTPDVIDPQVLFAHYVYLTGMSDNTIAQTGCRACRAVLPAGCRTWSSTRE